MNGKPLRLAFFLCGFAAFLNLYSTQGILRELGASFGIDAEHASWGVSVTTLAVALVAPFVGMLTAPFSRRGVIACAALAVALPVVGSAHAPGFASFLAARFAAGVLMPFIFATSMAYIGELFSRDEAMEVGALFVAGTTLGGFAGRFVTNCLTAVAGWRHALDLIACLCVATGLAIYACLPAMGVGAGKVAGHAVDNARVRRRPGAGGHSSDGGVEGGDAAAATGRTMRVTHPARIATGTATETAPTGTTNEAAATSRTMRVTHPAQAVTGTVMETEATGTNGTTRTTIETAASAVTAAATAATVPTVAGATTTATASAAPAATHAASTASTTRSPPTKPAQLTRLSRFTRLIRLMTGAPLLASLMIGACVLASQVASFTFVGLRLARAPFDFGTVGIGAIYAVFLVAVVVTPLAGRIARHRGPRDLALAAAALAIVGTLLTLSNDVAMILTGLALGSTAVFVEQASANAFISQSAPDARPTAIGLYLSCYYLGGSLGAILPIPAWQRWGWAGCVAFVVAAQAAVGALAFLFWREQVEAAHGAAG